MEQAQDHSGRKAFKITMMGCLGVVAAFIIVAMLMIACTVVAGSGGDHENHGKTAGHKYYDN